MMGLKMTDAFLNATPADLSAPAAEKYEQAGIGVFPVSDVIGAEIRGVDLSENLDRATLDAVHRAWLEHSVILLRDQRLSDGDLVRFSRYFGELDHGPTMSWQADEGVAYPEIFIISNVSEHGKPIGFLDDRPLPWHTDMSHTEQPSKASTLYALEVPDDGSGKTGFTNMYRVLDALPTALRAHIETLQLKHDPAHTLLGEDRDGFDIDAYRDLERSPAPVHPLVRTHPETGREALYLGRKFNGDHRAAHVVGLSRGDSDALLDELWELVAQEHFAWYHDWRTGDYLMWDNRCVMHGREPFDREARRVMHRTQIRDTVRPY
tara:strand:- start:937 stop:1899 length:963 start_codon:yes stop_codon:yes gene_type:complete